MSEENFSTEPHSRSDSEITADAIDPFLIDVYHDAGLIEAGDDHAFNRDTVMAIARNAFYTGAEKGLKDPNEIRFMIDEIIIERQKSIP